jgi:flagellar assembly factor FliW
LQVKTTRFGTIEIDETDIITFGDGVPGFPEKRQFIIIPYDEESPFILLQSATEDYLAFLMTNPFLFFKEYQFEIDRENMNVLDVQEEKDIAVYTMVTVPGGKVKEMTANLVAPVVINVHNKSGKQIVLEKSKYTTKHRLFEDEAASEGGK